MKKKVETPLSSEVIESLRAGDQVLLSGIIYSARDAAHKRIIDALENGESLPFDIEGQTIYYAGPCPPKPGHMVGPYGPTTSGRMDKYTEKLIECGLKGMIGKGDRISSVVDRMKKHKAVYFAAIGGAGSLIAAKIKKQTLLAYEDLGAEALYELVVDEFPLLVAIDCLGNNLYESEPQKYRNRYDEAE